MGYVHKVWPVILRNEGNACAILAFRHPLAGHQLIKGTLEPGERPEAGALRELAEESGIVQAMVVARIAEVEVAEFEQHWHLFLCQPQFPLADEWSHFTDDGGGLVFRYFWHPLALAPDANWYRLFHVALEQIHRWYFGR